MDRAEKTTTSNAVMPKKCFHLANFITSHCVTSYSVLFYKIYPTNTSMHILRKCSRGLSTATLEYPNNNNNNHLTTPPPPPPPLKNRTEVHKSSPYHNELKTQPHKINPHSSVSSVNYSHRPPLRTATTFSP